MNPYIVLKSVVTLFSFWYCVYYLWRDYRLDAFREDLFAVRDEMFLYAANKSIRFDDRAYTMLRTRINDMLRFGHWFTMTRVIIVLTTHRKIDINLNPWEEAMSRLPLGVRKQMEEFDKRVRVAVLQYLVYQSFFRYIVMRPLTLLKNPFHANEVIEEPRVVRMVEQLEKDALEQEEEERRAEPVTA
jgi:hypothetical protein